MIRVENKKESLEVINSLGLNKLPEIFIEKYDEDKILKFMNDYPSPTYAVRDREKSGSRLFKLRVEREKILNYVKGRSNFSLNVSGDQISSHQLLTGEIMITSEMIVYLCASDDKMASARDGANQPTYRLSAELGDPALKNISGIDYLIDYIFIHELFDITVEFAVFDKKLGTKNENVVIFELRSNF